MPVNEKTGKCKGFAFALVMEHVQKEILKLNGMELENRIVVTENATSARKRDKQDFGENHPKYLILVTNKHQEKQLLKFSAVMKSHVGATGFKEKKKPYIKGNSHLSRIRNDKFKDSISNVRYSVKSLSGANTN